MHGILQRTTRVKRLYYSASTLTSCCCLAAADGCRSRRGRSISRDQRMRGLERRRTPKKTEEDDRHGRCERSPQILRSPKRQPPSPVSLCDKALFMTADNSGGLPVPPVIRAVTPGPDLRQAPKVRCFISLKRDGLETALEHCPSSPGLLLFAHPTVG